MGRDMGDTRRGNRTNGGGGRTEWALRFVSAALLAACAASASAATVFEHETSTANIVAHFTAHLN